MNPSGMAGRLAGLRDRLRARRAGRALLAALSWGYGAGVWARAALYASRVLPSRRLPARTVCIGNLTTGGTGKTSAVLLAVQTLRKRRIKVAILTRGYGSAPKSRGVRVLVDGQTVSWQESGDEAWMMHQAMSGLEVPILVSPDRYRAGIEALEYYNPDVLLLDDGYQHLRLQRDLDIVLVNASDPFGGGRLLPLGNLREPLAALRRAGMAVLTHADRVPAGRLAEIEAVLARFNPRLGVLKAVHKPEFLFDLKFQRRRRLAYLKGKRIACFCGLGDPASFESQLDGIGAHPTQRWRYPDHHPYTLEELRSIENVREGVPVVTTLKDAPRLPAGWEAALSGEVFALGVQMEIVEGAQAWEAALVGAPAPAAP